MADVKCNGCGHIGPDEDFAHDRDLFQHNYVAGCPKCDNRQSPGDASMRMFGGKRPFEYMRDKVPADSDSLTRVLGQASEAS